MYAFGSPISQTARHLLMHMTRLGSRRHLRHLLPLLLQPGCGSRAPLLQLLRALLQLGECGGRVRTLALWTVAPAQNDAVAAGQMEEATAAAYQPPWPSGKCC